MYTITFPNQKIIITDKAPCDENHIYGILNIAALKYAASVLGGNGFKLYVRMMSHQDGFTYALSPKSIEADIGLSDKQYRTAVRELIEKGFLVSEQYAGNLYRALEDPTGVSEVGAEDKEEITVKVTVRLPVAK